MYNANIKNKKNLNGKKIEYEEEEIHTQTHTHDTHDTHSEERKEKLRKK